MSAQDCDLVVPPMAEWEFGFITFCDFDGEFEPLDVLPMESTPAPGESLSGRVLTISYNKEVSKSVINQVSSCQWLNNTSFIC